MILNCIIFLININLYKFFNTIFTSPIQHQITENRNAAVIRFNKFVLNIMPCSNRHIKRII